MITLYRTQKSTLADEIEDSLQDMVLSHEAVTVTSDDELPEGVDRGALPVLIEGETVIQGREALFDYLDKQQDVLDEWYRFQSDACYIEDDGSIC